MAWLRDRLCEASTWVGVVSSSGAAVVFLFVDNIEGLQTKLLAAIALAQTVKLFIVREFRGAAEPSDPEKR